MTETAGAESPEGTSNAKHNIANINQTITACADSMTEIISARADLNERAADVRSALKDAGVDMRAFQAAMRLRAMDEDNRENLLDQMRVTFAALGVGDQSEMFGK